MIRILGGNIRNLTILLLLLLLSTVWGQDCDEGYTEIDGDCYYQSDLDVLQQFIDNSQEGNPYPPPSNMRPIDLGVQEWENGRIVFLCYSFIGDSECYIYDYMLSGEIPQDIGNLTNLKYLIFSYSQLHGQIPASIGNLTHLTELKLHFNHLSGEIPNGIGNMVDLTHLYLRGNQFIGGIPDEIWNLVNLDRLYLEHNQLTGEIPPEIGNLVNLRYINLKDNQLNGEIPESIGNLTNIIAFSLSNNQLSGVIPYSICNFAQDNPYVWVYANQLCPPYPECLTDEQINGSWNTPGGEDDHQDTSGCQQLGDINGDGQLNILDIVLAANMVLADEYDEIADMNEDGELNIFDLVIMVNLVLYGVSDNTDIDWVSIPAGIYTYGQYDAILSIDYDYQISKYEITNAQYVTYLEDALASGDINVLIGSVLGYYLGDEENAAGDYIYLEIIDEHSQIIYDGISFSIVDGYEDHPVVEVSWFGANAFAEHYGWRLPDEYEWEKAARGDTGYDYPFGNSMNGSQANYYDSGDPYEQGEWSDWPNTSPVGFYNGQNNDGFVTTDSPSPYGVYDMAGNVWEYTGSWYFDGSPLRVRRGGSWYVGLTSGWCRSWLRDGNTPAGTYYDIGFRVARTN